MNKDNLLKLATYLLSDNLNAKFSMDCFDDLNGYDTHITDCGTVGCAIGHGPYAGLSKLVGENWFEYSRRVFAVQSFSDAFNFCFSSQWVYIDNTPTGAGKRILYLLRYNLPPGFGKLADFLNGNKNCLRDKRYIDAIKSLYEKEKL